MSSDAHAKRVIDTEAADKRRSDFYRALGEFVLEFANTEKEVLWILFMMSNVTDAVAKSIFSGVHLDRAKDFIKKIIAAEAARGVITYYSLMTKAFDHLELITRVRNGILHNGLQFWIDGDPVMHNRFKASAQQKVREHRISVQDLHNMILDLRKIGTDINVQFPPEGASIFPHVMASTRAPWRYKPPEQSAPPKKPRGSTPKR